MAAKAQFWKPGSDKPQTALASAAASARAEAASKPTPASTGEQPKTTRAENVTKLSSKVTTMRFMAKATNDEARKIDDAKKATAKAAAQWTRSVPVTAAPAAIAAAVLQSALGAASGSGQPSTRATSSSQAASALTALITGVKRKRLVCVADEESTVMDAEGNPMEGSGGGESVRLLEHGAVIGGRKSYQAFNKTLEGTAKAELAGETARADLGEEEMTAILMKRHGDAGGKGGKKGAGNGDKAALPRKLR